MRALGSYLRALRLGQRMTQTYVAEQAGINLSTLHRIEKGETEPGGENVLNLVAVVRGSYEDALHDLHSLYLPSAGCRSVGWKAHSGVDQLGVDSVLLGPGCGACDPRGQRCQS